MMKKAESEKIAEDFWREIEELANKYNVDLDYIMEKVY